MVIIFQGSVKDGVVSSAIAENLGRLGIPSEIVTASAHKTPRYLLDLLDKFNARDTQTVFICVAGRSNALGGFVDANTPFPVINCPPVSGNYGLYDIFSSLRMPSGVAPLTVLEPEAAALAAAKIIGLSDKKITLRIKKYQKSLKDDILNADKTQ